MEGVLAFFARLGTARLIAIAGAAVVVIVFFTILMTRVSDTDMTLLYDNLDAGDANQIISNLETMGILYRVEEDGKRIVVVPKSVGKARMKMAELGLPRGGDLGYEIFDRQEGFGTSTFVQNVNKIRALEGELARTVSAMEVVRTARVHLVLPQREMFSRDKQAASAAIFLNLVGSRTLGKEQVTAIQHLVASSVPQLEISKISIVDGKGNLIARSGEGDELSLEVANMEEIRLAREAEIRGKAERALEDVVGFGKVRVQVTAELDFDRLTKNSEIFDPEGTVVTSQQSITEAENSNELDKSVSVDNNLPENEGREIEQGGTNRNANRSEENVNFAVSKTIQEEIKKPGDLKRQSVAVLVDGTYTKNEVGNLEYQPRSDEDMEKYVEAVKLAIGFDADRGDQLEVINLQFTGVDKSFGDVDPSFFDVVDLGQYVKVFETLVLALVGLMVIMLVVKPLMNRLLDAAPSAADLEEEADMLAAQGLQPALEGPDGSTLPTPRLTNENSEIEQMLDMDKVDGQIRASSVKKIGDIIEKHPQEALQIIRTWLHDEA